MARYISEAKRRKWLRRYVPAEILGTVLALAAARSTYVHSGSYVAATAASWVGEGIGFYGYFVTFELSSGGAKYKHTAVI